MSGEILIAGIQDVTTALQVIAKKTGLSINALVNATGTVNGSLSSIGTGQYRNQDLSVVPLLRVLAVVNWELVGRSRDPRGTTLTPEGSIALRVSAADGGPLEVIVTCFQDLPRLLNTMAAANWLTITGLKTKAGVVGGSLVGVAKGTSKNRDARLGVLAALVAAADFELLVRPQHQTLRRARISMAAASRRG